LLNHPPQILTIATTGASGSIFLRQLLLAAVRDERITAINFIASDSALRVLAEELGLVGVIGVLALFLALVWRAFRISRMAAQAGLTFQSYVALAFGVWLGLQAIVNIGVNMGVLPTKGLTLPLLSYGRSSLLVSLAWIGVLLRIYHEVKCTSRSAVMRTPGGAR